MIDRLRRRAVSQIYDSNLTRQLYALYLLPWMTITSYYPVGLNVFERDWDLLIVLDACRVDAMKEVASEFNYITAVGHTLSVGSTSKEWMVNTFVEDYREQVEETTCISANAWVDTVLTDEVDFGFWSPTRGSFLESAPLFAQMMSRDTLTQDDFSEFYSISSLGTTHGVTLAEDVTDYAICVGRQGPFERMLVHYMQPHAPYLHGIDEGEELSKTQSDPFAELRKTGDRERIYQLYVDNLRYVLTEVERLVNNINAEKVVITSDHGELFGEWGMSNHIAGIPHPDLKQVPWVETEAVDRNTSRPTIPTGESTSTVEDRLSDLGYL